MLDLALIALLVGSWDMKVRYVWSPWLAVEASKVCRSLFVGEGNDGVRYKLCGGVI